MALENIKLFYRLREVVVKLFNDYSSFVSKAKCKTIYGKGIPSMSARIARSKIFDNSNLKINNNKFKK